MDKNDPKYLSSIKKAARNIFVLRAAIALLAAFCLGAAFYYGTHNFLKTESEAVLIIDEQQPLNNKEPETMTDPEILTIDPVIDEVLSKENDDQISQMIEEISNTPEIQDQNMEELSAEENMPEVQEPKQPRVILDRISVPVPLLAIVIDDMGINQKRTKEILSLKAPLTSSFLTYGRNLDRLAQEAAEAGHEIMIHAPMEPKGPASLAPDTMKVAMDDQEIKQLFASMLDKFKDIRVSGINNHMGSKFTEDEEKLGCVMKILKEKNMFFLDSKTTAASKGKKIALDEDIDFIARDVFLDNENEYHAILKQLQKAEKIAQKKGFVVAICHPKTQTYAVLRDWLQAVDSNKIKLVHLSEIIKATNVQ